MSWIPDEVHNYYEDLLKQHLQSLKLFDTHDEDYIADFCCLVLNQLPAQYIRHNVDMYHYTSPQKFEEMAFEMRLAINNATSWLDREENKRYIKEC